MENIDKYRQVFFYFSTTNLAEFCYLCFVTVNEPTLDDLFVVFLIGINMLIYFVKRKGEGKMFLFRRNIMFNSLLRRSVYILYKQGDISIFDEKIIWILKNAHYKCDQL